LEVGFQRWRVGNSTIPQQFSQSHSKFLFPQQIPPANFLKLPANSHAIFPAISLANFRVKFLLPYIALFEIIILPYLKISFIPKSVAGLKSRYCLIRNYDIALSLSQSCCFEIPILPYSKLWYCLIWKSPLSQSWGFESITLSVLKPSYCLIWTRDIALFEKAILPYLDALGSFKMMLSYLYPNRPE